MEGIFLEFENENALRSYPFASGCLPTDNVDFVIPVDVFVDAALYPINPSGTLYLSSVSEDGVFSISDSTGVIMTGSANGNLVELYDLSPFMRHVGTLVAASNEALSEFAGRGILREYDSSETAFASSCVFPVAIDGVISISVGDSGSATGNVSFSNGDSDDVRVSSGIREDGRRTLRFDVLPRPSVPDDLSIRRIICVVDGQTPFRIERSAFQYNTIVLTMQGEGVNIDKEDVCAAAHRENSFEMSDTCGCDGKCEQDIPSKDPLPYTYQRMEVFIPPDPDEANEGIEEGADNAFYLAVPNLAGYSNPISITMEDGIISPKTDDLEIVEKGDSVELAEGEMLDSVTSKGIIIQVPGLSGGAI